MPAPATILAFQPRFAQQAAAASTSAVSSPAIRALPPVKLQSEVIAWCDAAARQAEEESSQSPSVKLIPRIIQYLNSQQWPTRPTAYGTSRPVTNIMFRQYWELVSLLTDGKPEPQIKIWDKQDDYSSLQTMLMQLLALWASKPEYPAAFQDVVGFGLLARAFGRVHWNPRLNGGFGDTELLAINPLNLAMLGGDGTLDNCELVIESRMVTIASLRRRYGSLADGLRPEPNGIAALAQPMKPSQFSSAEWSKFSPMMRRVLGVRGGSAQPENLFPVVRERQFWLLDPSINETGETVQVGPPRANWGYKVEPGQLLFPRGRLIVVAGSGRNGRVLDDTCNPYFYPQHHPYVDFTPLKGPWSPEGMSVMGNQIGPQDIINRVFAGLLETIKAGLTPTIITPRNAVSRADLDTISTTISGGKLEFNQNAGMAPSFRPQPQIPQLALPFAGIVQSEMEKSTGSAALNDAAQKDQIPSHDTMELIQNSRSSLVRVMGRSLERFMSRAGQLVVSNMLQFYTVGHRVAILGHRGLTSNDFSPLYGSLLNQTATTTPEQFVRRVQFSIRPGSALTFDQETRVQMAALLQQRGLLSANNLFRALDANIDLAENKRELLEEQMEKLKLAALANGLAALSKQGPQGPH